MQNGTALIFVTFILNFYLISYLHHISFVLCFTFHLSFHNLANNVKDKRMSNREALEKKVRNIIRFLLHCHSDVSSFSMVVESTIIISNIT